MSLLSDRDILKAIAEGELAINPYEEKAVQPASIDLSLGFQFRYYPHAVAGSKLVVDPMLPVESGGIIMLEVSDLRKGDTFDVRPGQFLLAHTAEAIRVGGGLAAQVYGKSSIGRIGLRVENAGYIDPGFSGQITLELRNETEWTIRLTVGMPICQIVLHRTTSEPIAHYGPERGSRYQYQSGATPSRYGIRRG